MKIKTSSGFECDIPEGLTKDYRYVRARQALKSKDPDTANQAALDLVPIVFGDDDTAERFLDHLAQVNGRALFKDVYSEIGEILDQAREKDEKVKNS